jgi:CO/xanthine dehydrogenase Mo-binding subunit
MGLGQAVMENFIVEGDQIISQDLEKYPIPTSMDVPLIRSGYVEDREPLGPFGAKGFSECPVVPAAPAIINAIHAATGVWIDHLPATPERVYLALHQKNNSKNSEND